jgi:hypothetical protein
MGEREREGDLERDLERLKESTDLVNKVLVKKLNDFHTQQETVLTEH